MLPKQYDTNVIKLYNLTTSITKTEEKISFYFRTLSELKGFCKVLEKHNINGFLLFKSYLNGTYDLPFVYYINNNSFGLSTGHQGVTDNYSYARFKKDYKNGIENSKTSLFLTEEEYPEYYI